MTLWLRIIHRVASWLPRRDIYAEAGKLYLSRYRVFGWTEGSSWRGPSLYLHQFHLPDQDRLLHNHPWRRAWSLILAGGYTEERGFRIAQELAHEGAHRLRAGQFNVIGPDDYHRITTLHGQETWTLFFVAPKSRTWSFWCPKHRRPIPWRERLAERGIPS